jgi:tRNA U34 2-thiouridine synthase MnmA/TrmU
LASRPAEPLYVVHLDADRARVIVGPREALETHKVFLRDMNWLGDRPLGEIPAQRASSVYRQGPLDAPAPPGSAVPCRRTELGGN